MSPQSVEPKPLATKACASESYRARQLAGYGALRMPLALMELPLYLFLPILYGQTHGLSLTFISAVLFATRAIDAVADPILGAWIATKRCDLGYWRWIMSAAPVLALGFAVLLLPRPDSFPVSMSLILGSIMTFAAYSVLSIAYQSWGADISRSDAEAAKLVGIREAFGLLGVILASALLQVETILYLIALFLVLLGVALVSLRAAPPVLSRPLEEVTTEVAPKRGLSEQLRSLFADPGYKRLLAVFVVNGIATAIPATLVIFFIRDVIGAPSSVPIFLLTYFSAAAVGTPVWIWACKKFPLETVWLIGMILAVLAFAWAVGLRAGNTTQFLIICVLTGLALGADLIVPPAILSGVIKASGRGQSDEASYFGVWSFTVKFNLALAAIISLPLVEFFGYIPGQTRSDDLSLSLVYAALPCALKLVAAILLWLRPIIKVV